MYSSIDEEERSDVIKKCYWPIFKLVNSNIPIGIEAPAITLEIINKIDPKWIETLSKFINDGKLEFIGSGYSQIIGPLVPEKVNLWNQKLGLETYYTLLEVKPKLALVNEMAYSGGMVEHYKNAGYEGIIMEWNNPRSGNPEWEYEWRYHPQKAIFNNGKSIPLIWADSIAFQKFQRYSHGEYSLEEYNGYIQSNVSECERYFPLYSNDVEIFDYRPNRYQTEAQIDGDSEWHRIINLYHHLNRQDWCELVFPSDVLIDIENPNAGLELKLESSAQPIPVKKQEKYNINRWALTGRNDLSINTKCYQIYDAIIKNGNEKLEDWKELCYLWSSDFRTHITEKRWKNYQQRLKNAFDKQIKKERKNIHPKTEKLFMDGPNYSYTEMDRFITIENDLIKLILDKYKGISIRECIFKNISEKPLFGTLEHGYFEDISLGADFFSGHAIIDRMGQHKITDLGEVEPEIIKSDREVIVCANQELKNIHFSHEISMNQDSVSIKKSIRLKNLFQTIIRPLNLTFNSDAWDKDTLYYHTHNGGINPENFYLKGQSVSHGDIYSSLISSRHGLGNTEGIFAVGDKDKTLTLECDMTKSALIPTMVFLPQEDDKFFFRLQYSAKEMDETIKSQMENFFVEIDFKIYSRISS